MSSHAQNEKSDYLENPFRVLFLLGSLCGFVGVMLWVFFKFGLISFYPKFSHVDLMFFGLFWSFIAGFLMTAIPKMTSTFSTQVHEVSVAIGLVLLQIVLNIRNLQQASVIIFILQNIFLLYFLIRRFIQFKKIPFSGFVFLPFAFIQAILGSIIFLLQRDDSYRALVLLAGEAFVLNLIIGIGSRLVPVICRLPNALMPHQHKGGEKRYPSVILALIINLGFILELFAQSESIILVRILAVCVSIIYFHKLFIKPTRWTVVGVGLKLSLVFILIGLFSEYHYGVQSIAVKHLIYIPGFLMLTLLISFRVIVAHSGESIDYEIKSKRIGLIIGGLLVTVLFRLLSGAQVTDNFIIWSVLVYLMSFSLWVSKIWKTL